MSKSLSVTLCICALGITGGVLLCCWRISLAADTANLALWNISTAAYNAKPTIDNVNSATGVWAKASQKQADAADALIRDLRVISWHLDRSFLKLDTVLDTSNDQIKHVGPLLDSFKTASDAIPGTLGHVNTAVDASGGAINGLQRVTDDFHARLTDKRIDALMDDLRGMTDSGNGILADARKVSDKATADYLKPTKWYMVPVKRFGELWDIGAAVARHTP